MFDAVLLAASTTTSDPYWQRFFLSPGAGGIAVFAAAVVAGAVAWRNADKQSVDSRAKAADERRKVEAEQNAAAQRAREERERVRQEKFWTTTTWIYDRATAERREARLSPAVALALLDALGEEAETELEVAVVLRVLGMTRAASTEVTQHDADRPQRLSDRD